MSTPSFDHWPSQFGRPANTPPVAFLRAQAALLVGKTDGLVEAFVRNSKHNGDLHYQFYLRAPALDNYSYLLLSVQHSVGFYPATLVAETTGQQFRADNQEQFVERLRAVLSSPEAVRVVESLLAQSRELTD